MVFAGNSKTQYKNTMKYQKFYFRNALGQLMMRRNRGTTLYKDDYNSRLIRTLHPTVRTAQSQVTVKRLLDIAGASLGLVVFSPVMLLVALLLRLTMGEGVLFRQQRPGLRGKPFVMFKFKTMRDAYNKRGEPLPDEKRLTTLGKFLRATSLDELPELVNVLKGEMSLVGPRPLLMQYLERYSLEQARRHEVRPGITGWAQINGRNAINWEEKFKLDVWYVDNQSLELDCMILWKTAFKVFARDGIHHTNHVTMPEFKGDDAHAQ
jgi:sugar transferase EpsL